MLPGEFFACIWGTLIVWVILYDFLSKFVQFWYKQIKINGRPKFDIFFDYFCGKCCGCLKNFKSWKE
jgi:hypothetical protein